MTILKCQCGKVLTAKDPCPWPRGKICPHFGATATRAPAPEPMDFEGDDFEADEEMDFG